MVLEEPEFAFFRGTRVGDARAFRGCSCAAGPRGWPPGTWRSGGGHVGGDRRLELEVTVLAPAGGAGLANVEGLGIVRLEPRVVGLGALALPPWTF